LICTPSQITACPESLLPFAGIFGYFTVYF